MTTHATIDGLDLSLRHHQVAVAAKLEAVPGNVPQMGRLKNDELMTRRSLGISPGALEWRKAYRCSNAQSKKGRFRLMKKTVEMMKQAEQSLPQRIVPLAMSSNSRNACGISGTEATAESMDLRK